mmetsp:Transcript_38455/g.80638  ORF Transcript_38455/g.80638 Transcript_38455/m.80638 type:complete len:114 (+) Transcript_38455:60-401(+)
MAAVRGGAAEHGPTWREAGRDWETAGLSRGGVGRRQFILLMGNGQRGPCSCCKRMWANLRSPCVAGSFLKDGITDHEESHSLGGRRQAVFLDDFSAPVLGYFFTCVSPNAKAT